MNLSFNHDKKVWLHKESNDEDKDVCKLCNRHYTCDLRKDGFGGLKCSILS